MDGLIAFNKDGKEMKTDVDDAEWTPSRGKNLPVHCIFKHRQDVIRDTDRTEIIKI